MLLSAVFFRVIARPLIQSSPPSMFSWIAEPTPGRASLPAIWTFSIRTGWFCRGVWAMDFFGDCQKNTLPHAALGLDTKKRQIESTTRMAPFATSFLRLCLIISKLLELITGPLLQAPFPERAFPARNLL